MDDLQNSGELYHVMPEAKTDADRLRATGSTATAHPKGAGKVTYEPRKRPTLRFSLDQWDAERAFVGDPEPIRWLVKGSIPAGVSGMVAAAGDTGKSYILLDLCERVARGFG